MLTKEEMERKFNELGMPATLSSCKRTRTDRDPAVPTHPPDTSVIHKREHGIRFTTASNESIALIFIWYGPDGTEHWSIREFLGPDGILYRLRLRVPG